MANDRMRAMWADSAGGWVEHRDVFEAELAGFADALLDTARPGPGQRVLDVGCGTGGLSARCVAAGAEALGVDISPSMVEAATELVPGAGFLVADAQTEDLTTRGPFTQVISRFGVMFFDDPTAAFANIRRATAPGAALAFVCWRGIEENQMFTLGTDVLTRRLDPPPSPPVAGQPGPMAFADPDHVRSLLGASGWSGIAVEPLDVLCDYGSDGTDGVEARLTIVLNTTGGRQARNQLEPALGPDGWAELMEEVRAEIRDDLTDGRVAFNGATWLVTATNSD